MIRLGVNIDHVATVRQARRETFPDVVAAAMAAVEAGAHGITAHLREDRRHIQDADIIRLKERLSAPLNLEMAASEDIVKIAESVRPAWACLVPEKRTELTTEGGLNVGGLESRLTEIVQRLHHVGTKVSFFVEPSLAVVDASARCGADAVELHTGVYAQEWRKSEAAGHTEIRRLVQAATAARERKLVVNAGHGLDLTNVAALAGAFGFQEFNIGFSIVARALFIGMGPAVREMNERMNTVCAES